MEILENLGWFIAGILFASIGWGFVSLILLHMYLSASRELDEKFEKEFENHKTGGFKL